MWAEQKGVSVESVTQAQRQRLPSSPQKGLDQEQDSLGKDLGDLGVCYICEIFGMIFSAI